VAMRKVMTAEMKTEKIEKIVMIEKIQMNKKLGKK
jgi:hypothetical protein